MNDQGNNAAQQAPEKRLLEQLARLDEFPGPMTAAAGEAGLMRSLRARLARQRGPARFFHASAGAGWEIILIALIVAFLAWDIARIVRFIFR